MTILFVRKSNNLEFKNLVKLVGNNIFFIFISNFGLLNLDISLNVNSFYVLNEREFFIKNFYLKKIRNLFCFYIFNVCFCWCANFEIIGYNYEIKKRLKKNLLKLDLGFSKHKILLYFPYYVFVLGRKRSFDLFCLSLNLFYTVFYFIRCIRDLFPYKLRGIISGFTKRYKLKSGKRSRYN